MRMVVCRTCFNPRTHGGCDVQLLHLLDVLVVFQSTHPRGVRQFSADYVDWVLKFQSTHPRGVRPSHVRIVKPFDLFQSTHPRGVRRSNGNFNFTIRSSFNPRTHGGCDFVAHHNISYDDVSIHAPTGGATYSQNTFKSSSSSFNPRTHGGCDTDADVSAATHSVSIHAPTGGATSSNLLSCFCFSRVSIHAPTGGATTRRRCGCCIC